MFRIQQKQEYGFDKFILADDQNTCKVEIIPACGAMLHAFIVKDHSGNEINIIDSYASKDAYDNFAEEQGFRGLKLSPYPCRIKNGRYEFDGNTYSFTNGKPGFAAIHGFLYNKAFEVINKTVDSNSATLVLQYQYDGDNSGYPFPYQCEVLYMLEEGKKLTIKTSIQNTGNNDIPVADGWHPYFSFGKKVDALQLQFHSNEMVEFENLVPTGRLIPHNDYNTTTTIGSRDLDNSFVVDFCKSEPLCVLSDPDTGWQLQIQPDGNYPYLQIYIPPHRNSIAIENLSAPPDAFNNGIGLKRLASGESVDFTTVYTMTLL